MDSFRLLTTDSPEEGEVLAGRLEKLNLERRDLTERAFAAVMEQVQRLKELPPILLVTDPSITPGVAGLIAGRLVEQYHRPAVVMASLDPDYVTASARSIARFNIIEALADCRDLFVRYGGHAQAAGFTLPRAKIPRLTELLTCIAEERLSAQDLHPALPIDAELNLAGLRSPVLQWLRQLEPFGPGNPRPTFLARNLQVVDTQLVGPQGQHVRLHLREGDRQGTALAFNQGKLWDSTVTCIDLAYSISTDSWNGVERTTLKVLDYRPAPGNG